MQCFRYKADRIPVLFITLFFVLDLLVFFTTESLGILFAWMLFGLFVKSFIAAWNHHHQHVATFRQRILNRLLEVVYTFHTGITTNVWVLHHNLGHHVNYLDQTKDESGWQRKDGSRMGVIEYTLTIAITGYLRAFRVGQSYPKFQKGFLGMGVVNLILLGMFFWLNPRNALFVFLIPMVVVYLATCWITYFHHSGLETQDHLHASHNVTNRLYNIISGNLGYHTAHHMKQGLHWSKLPEFHKTIEDQIPKELLNPEFPFVGRFFTNSRSDSSPSESAR